MAVPLERIDLLGGGTLGQEPLAQRRFLLLDRAAEAGLASGLFNTTLQIGGALGIAALSTVASSQTDTALESGTPLPNALVDGFSEAFTVGVGIAALGIIAALTLIRRDELEYVPEPEPEPVLDPVG